MENIKIENWDQKKEQLKKEYPELTEEDLIYEAGKEIELLKRLQKKMKKDQKVIRKWLSFMG